MNDEQILDQQTAEESGRVSLTNILYALRAHLLLILIITVLFAAGGVGYSKIRKPVYTATVPVQFDVVIKATDEHAHVLERDNQVASTNYLFRYVESAVGICQSGEVIDRANVYYNYYLQSGKNIDEFIDELYAIYKPLKAEHGEIPDYPVTEENRNANRNRWFSSGNVGTRYTAKDQNNLQVVDFSLWVRNLDSTVAREMARIYALAADVSLNEILVFDNGTAGLIDLADSVSGISATPDMSMTKIVVIAAALGLIFALVTVYIMYLSDNTVKSKEQLEVMSGSSVIAYIDNVAEVK